MYSCHQVCLIPRFRNKSLFPPRRGRGRSEHEKEEVSYICRCSGRKLPFQLTPEQHDPPKSSGSRPPYCWGSIGGAHDVSPCICISLGGCKVFSQPAVETVRLDLSLHVSVILGRRVAALHVRKRCSRVSRACSDSSTLRSEGTTDPRASSSRQTVGEFTPPPSPAPSSSLPPLPPPLFLLLSPSLGSC